MRLRRINLTRYGHFTNFALDFGEKPVCAPDFHIIFGENEAGKSTTFNGYLDLLFGIEERCKYSFRHDYNTLRIDAALEINNSCIELSRIKRRNGSLLDINDQPISEKILASALHGLSRDGYRMMFSLDDETIQLGGEEILASKGDFGRLLFAGATGLADLSKRLEAIKEHANAIYSERSRSCEITMLQQSLKQLKEERKNLDIQVNAYERLSETEAKAEKAYLEARIKRDSLRKELQNLNLLKDALGIHNNLKILERELAPILHLPEVPLDWIEEVRDLQKKTAVAKGNQDDAHIDIANNKNELDKLPKNSLILRMHKEIEEVAALALFDEAARKRLPRLRLDLLKMDHEFDEIRQRLGINQTNHLTDFMIPDDKIAKLDLLLQDAASFTQKLNFAKQEYAEAKMNLSQAKENEKNTGQPDKNIMELVALYDRYTEDDAQLRLELAEKTLSGVKLRIEKKLEKTSHWTGSRNQKLPTLDQAQRWHEKIRGLKELLATKKMQQAQHQETRATFDGRVKSLLGQLDGISDSFAAKVREMRDNAWATHRSKLDKETADAFENILAEDDRIRNERINATDRLSQFRIAEKDLSEIDSKLCCISDAIQKIEKDLKQVQDEIKPVFLKAGLPEEFQIEDLPGWLEEIREIYELIAEEDAYRLERDKINAEYHQRLTKLLTVLAKVCTKPSENLDLKELCEIAKPYRNDAMQNRARYDQTKKTISDAETQVQRREKDLHHAEADFKQWQNNWMDALTGCWFRELNVDQIRAQLSPLRALAALAAKQKTLIEEISQKETDCNNFRKSVSKLVHLLGLEESEDPSAQFLHLQLNLKQAQNIEILREAIIKRDATDKVKLAKAEKELFRIEARLKEMTSCFIAVSTLDQLALTLDQVKKKKELTKILSDKEKNLLEHLRVKTRQEADEMLNSITIEDLEKRLIEVNDECQEAEQAFEQRIAERQDAIRAIEAIGGDAGVTRLNEKYQSVLLEIASKTERALSLHLGLMAADLALTTYRDRHRSDLLKQTADIFSAITAGDYKHLATQPSQSGDLLVAVRSDGRSITVNEMSKGASFQMYLALRLAAYRWICKKEGPLPFIGDDIMETFDDNRVEASIYQLSEIAKHGQVIYFTHHRHLCEIAKSVLGNSVTIHEIPKRLREN